ncbi:hypothetical protein KP509_33G043200 [Ceratopteris richardii]|uniref:Integrase catalytic domain-containing protein n=1 Tax=Ceratopteris richardii TaxID=49495 RepID=A0A8T2QQ64_CERRI|nr:hypothetical protein KP509_33G043200 [Ceratopteris richardii]
MSSADHPQTDGQTERVNQILEDMLRAYVSQRQIDWDSYLPLVEFAYNNRPHKVIGMSPFEMNYGMNPIAPSTIGMPKKCPSASEFLENLQANLEIAKAKMQEAADRVKEYADRKKSPRSFEEGDRVFLQVPARSTSLSTGNYSKLSPRYCGPWKIVKKLIDVAYRLELPTDCRVHLVFHVNKLRKYISREDNLIDGIISLQETDREDQSLDRILDRRQKRLRNRFIQEYL